LITLLRPRSDFWETWLVVPVGALLLVGLLTVYSATAMARGGDIGMAVRHLLSIFVGLLAAFAMASLPPRVLEDFSPLFYVLSVFSLVVVLLAGEVSGGAGRWLVLGPVRFQPSEPAKIATILFLAQYLAGKRCDLRRFVSLAGALVILGVPTLLVLKEPDLGTALAFVAFGAGMLIWAGLPWLTLFVFIAPLVMALLSRWIYLGVPFLAAAVLLLRWRRIPWLLIGIFAALQIGIAFEAPRLWNSLAPYQRARLSTFLDPEREPAGAGYQVIQSKIAIGSGGITGRGYGRGSQKALAFLPRQHTDFIYSVIGEEWGFVGSVFTLLLFGILLLRSLVLARVVRSRFGSLVAVGVISVLFYHVAINIAMTVGLAPVTGLPLPFISFGGSFMVSTLAGTGLLLGVIARRRER
jgi:rod shape determining protein RodA